MSALEIILDCGIEINDQGTWDHAWALHKKGINGWCVVISWFTSLWYSRMAHCLKALSQYEHLIFPSFFEWMSSNMKLECEIWGKLLATLFPWISVFFHVTLTELFVTILDCDNEIQDQRAWDHAWALHTNSVFFGLHFLGLSRMFKNLLFDGLLVLSSLPPNPQGSHFQRHL